MVCCCPRQVMEVSGSRRYRDRALRVQEGDSHETQYGNYSKYSAHLTFEDGEVSKSKLLCQAIGDQVATSLLGAGATSSQDLLFWLVEQRDSLARRCIRVGMFLFSTLALLALVMFGQTRDFAIMGIKLEDPTFFVFAALVLGNLVYVVSTGLFVKGIAYEFLLLNLAKKDHFQLGAKASAFLACHSGNVFSYTRLSGLLERIGGGGRALIHVTNVYMKYVMVVCYGIFFYSVLGRFLYELGTQHHADVAGANIYFWTLVILNVMTVITSFVIFLRIREIQDIELSRTFTQPKSDEKVSASQRIETDAP